MCEKIRTLKIIVTKISKAKIPIIWKSLNKSISSVAQMSKPQSAAVAASLIDGPRVSCGENLCVKNEYRGPGPGDPNRRHRGRAREPAGRRYLRE